MSRGYLTKATTPWRARPLRHAAEVAARQPSAARQRIGRSTRTLLLKRGRITRHKRAGPEWREAVLRFRSRSASCLRPRSGPPAASVKLVRLALATAATASTLLAILVLVRMVLLAAGTVPTPALQLGRLLIIVRRGLVRGRLVKGPRLVVDAADLKSSRARQRCDSKSKQTGKQANALLLDLRPRNSLSTVPSTQVTRSDLASPSASSSPSLALPLPFSDDLTVPSTTSCRPRRRSVPAAGRLSGGDEAVVTVVEVEPSRATAVRDLEHTASKMNQRRLGRPEGSTRDARWGHP